jgi:phage terminase large subunit
MTNPFKISPVFEWNYKTTKQIVINQGGTSSGKTYSLLQVLACKAAEEPNQIITVVGQDIPNLKSGAIRDFESILNNPFFRSMIKSINITNREYRLHNGSLIEFKSFDNEQDAKSGKRDYLFMNEANGIPYSVYDQLQIRTTKQVFIDYNPTFAFWVHDKLIGSSNKVEVFISNYTHNPFLKQSIREKIEALKHKDKNKWRVYGLGLTGNVEGAVFPAVNWIPKMPTTGIKRSCLGMDFGYSNDPTTLVRLALIQGELYGELLLYKTGLTNQDIGKEFDKLGITKGRKGGTLIMADSAEPKSIKELKNLGWRVKPCKKGSDSIRAGIDCLKSYGALNLVNNELWKQEQQKYVWTIDRKDGRAKNKPVDKFNHIWDAFRYGEQGIRKNELKLVSYSS